MKTKDGAVVNDRHNSHRHVAIELLREALGHVTTGGREFLVEEVDFGRVVGVSTCVTTREDDEIVFARRPRRFGPTRFVKNRLPEPCQKVVVILKKGIEDDYVLISAFVGSKAEPEPWDRNATPESNRFWATHALVWGSEPVI